MTAQIGTTGWTLAASGTAGITNATLNTIVTGLTGNIGVTGMLTCTLLASVPATGLPVTANGTVEAATTGASILSLGFDAPLTAPLTGLAVTSANPTCQSAANSSLAAALPSVRTALLDALNARAQTLSCLACRAGSCAQGLACVGG